jgi:hypothetical protein
MSNASEKFNNFFSTIVDKVLKTSGQKRKEHYIGVIHDSNKDNYDVMLKKFIEVKNDKIEEKIRFAGLEMGLVANAQLKLDGMMINSGGFNKMTLDEYTKIKDKWYKNWNKIVNKKNDYSNDRNNRVKDIGQDYKDIINDVGRGKFFAAAKKDVSKLGSEVKAGVDQVGVLWGEQKLIRNAMDKENTDHLFKYYTKRGEVLKYLREHYTYIFIGQDNTWTMMKEGDKTLPATYCTKNCIYNSNISSTSNPFNTSSKNYIKNNNNSELLKLFGVGIGEATFPPHIDDYLASLGIMYQERSYVEQLSQSYCKCATDTSLQTSTSELCYQGEYIKDDLDKTTKKHGCYPIESFTANNMSNLQEGMQSKFNVNTDVYLPNSKIIDSIHTEKAIISQNKNKFKSSHKSFFDLTKHYQHLQEKEPSIKEKNMLYKKMISDNVLITHRYSLIRYLIIIILIFSILLIMKYINII